MAILIDASRLERKRKRTANAQTLENRHGYFQGVAEARFVLRKVFRLIEEQAKAAGLDSLEHQALIQIYGSPMMRLRVKEVAERLDIVPAFASNMLKSLEQRGYVTRTRGETDQRVIVVAPTPKGKETLHRVDEQVRVHVDYFTRQLSQEAREAAISVLMFYIGISLHVPTPTRVKIVRGS